MLQRALATVFIVILLLAQTLTGVCRAQCERMSPDVTASCHSMNMDMGTDHLVAPCTSHPCTSDVTLLVQRQTVQQDLSSRPPDSPAASSLAPLSALAMPSHTASPLRLSLVRPPSHVSSLTTTLRV